MAGEADRIVDVLRVLPRHGALPRCDAVQRFGERVVDDLLRDRHLIEPWSGVVIAGRYERDPMARAAAALIRTGPSAVLSGATAAAMHGCTAAEDATVHVTVPYDRQVRSLPGLAVCQSWIRESDVVLLHGLRVQALDVAITELLCTGPQRAALACLEQVLVDLSGAAAQFRAMVAERLARRVDRRGTRQASALLNLARADPRLAAEREPGRDRSSSGRAIAHLGGR